MSATRPLDPLSLGLAQDLDFLDDLAARFRRDPRSVDPSFLPILDGEATPAPVAPTNGHAISALETAPSLRLDKVYALVNAYRARGHLEAHLDPLDHLPRERHPDLDPTTYGFTERDMSVVVPALGLHGIEQGPLGEILHRLRATYCGTIGVELMHISAPDRRTWLQMRMEPTLNRPDVDRDGKLHILEKLVAAESFERFIHTRYIGTKRFSIEGSEALIPLLDGVLECAGLHEIEEVVLGMAHRGRLNVLCNIVGKRAGDIFAEFEDIDPMSVLGGGDVKYHLGYSSEYATRGGHALHLSLAFNPSHLEAVDPVVAGRVRAKQRRRGGGEGAKSRVLGVLVHGDAAFAGQGLVPETLNLSQLKGYRTGGTVHVIVNNQIGFTTSPLEARSTPYPTDVAKMIQVPIFHVNGDDPEAVAHVVKLAMSYRREFQSDVVIDLFCFRRYGHNEGDEPSFTQPLLYRKIERHPPLARLYAERLAKEGVIPPGEYDAMLARAHAALEQEFTRARERAERPKIEALGGVWSGFRGGLDANVPDVDTGVPRERLAQIGERLSSLPPGFHPHPKIARLLAARADMARGAQPLDWGMAEALAFGSLVWDGRLVRLTGQDSRRGTFSHRHAVVVDVETGAEYIPLEQLHPQQGFFRIYDSPLSEAAVLGFEFGYSLDYPDGLVAWEAQFGDFVNGAQVLLDQFISSSEDKWQRLSGLVLLLPHGYEGQGPEHSSARFERFLQLAAEDNMQVCYPSTPAQYFHLLRRQVMRPFRKPLVVMTPKSLLRLAAARSPLETLAAGRFQRVLDDLEIAAEQRGEVRRVLLCTGKIYYELAEERRRRGEAHTAIVRLEQLYPLREAELSAVLDGYPRARELVWVQEEPANMGARTFLAAPLARLAASRALRVVCRPESASPATGSQRAHQIEQQALFDQAFAVLAA